jgi:hypothetical protein
VCDEKITMNGMDGYDSSWSLPTERYLTEDIMGNHEEPGRTAGNKVNFV